MKSRTADPLDAFALGERRPARIVEPADAREAAATIRAAAQAGEAVVAWGGGTLQRAANAPVRYDVALSTARLDAVHEYDRHDLTAGVGAGLTLHALERTLAAHGQFIPFDAPLPTRATVGGTLAAGWAGPRRAAYGRPRDLLIGATCALADGTLAKSGGMVVKNVTGYDMGKLYIGSHGTLGVFVRANFKLLPAPATRRLAVSPFADAVRERVVENVHGLEIAPVAMLIADGFAVPGERREAVHAPPGSSAIALFEGSEATVDRALRDYRSALGAAGIAETRIVEGRDAAAGFQALVDQYVAASSEPSITLLGRGLPSDATTRAARARASLAASQDDEAGAGPALDEIVDVLTGDVVLRLRGGARAGPDVWLRAVHALRDALRGRASVIAGTAPVLALVDAWGEPPATLATMRGLKDRFDPHGVLAPGRYVGGI